MRDAAIVGLSKTVERETHQMKIEFFLHQMGDLRYVDGTYCLAFRVCGFMLRICLACFSLANKIYNTPINIFLFRIIVIIFNKYKLKYEQEGKNWPYKHALFFPGCKMQKFSTAWENARYATPQKC